MKKDICQQWKDMLSTTQIRDTEIIDIKTLNGQARNCNSPLVVTDGFVEGKAATILRGGSNANFVLKLVEQLGYRDITIFHIEEKIDHMEDVFITSVLEPAHAMFERVSVIWRNDSNLDELLRSISGEYAMVYLGAPLAVSEIKNF